MQRGKLCAAAPPSSLFSATGYNNWPPKQQQTSSNVQLCKVCETIITNTICNACHKGSLSAVDQLISPIDNHYCYGQEKKSINSTNLDFVSLSTKQSLIR